MKNMKKMVSIFVVVIIISLCCSPVFSSSQQKLSKEEIKVYNTVTDFLKKKAEKEWIYSECDLLSYLSIDSEKNHTNAIQLQNLVAMTDVLKDYRQYVGKEKTNFSVTYELLGISVCDNVASVDLKENVEYFIINGNGEPTYCGESYTVSLEKVGQNWLISAVEIHNNTLFNEIKNDEHFDKQDYLNQSIRAYLNSIENEIAAPSIEERGAVNPITNAYKPSQAAAYARIYGKAYNSKFYDATSAGGDCANFGSQCVWAGFGGDLTRCGTTSHNYPFDYSGTAAASDPTLSTCWNQQYSGTGNGGSCWFLSQWLYDYAVNSSHLPSEHGWKAICNIAWDTGTRSNYFSPANNYLGALLFVQGSGTGTGAEYGHTIVINYASTNSPNNMYYCAHTCDRSNALLADSLEYINKPIRYVIPTEYKIQTNCTGTYTTHNYPATSTGYSAVCSRCGYENMYMNLKWARYTDNSNVTIQVSEIRSNRCYEIKAVIKLNNTVIDQFTVNNTSTLSATSTNMTTAGLYTVDVTVKDKPGGLTKNYQYTIRVRGVTDDN